MEKALAEGPGAGTGFPSFAAAFSSRVPAGLSLSSRGERRLRVGPSGGVDGRRGSQAVRLCPLGQRHRREVGSVSYSPCKFKTSPAKC